MHKQSPRTFYKSHGAKDAGFQARNGKSVQVKEMVPELAGFRLKPYLNYRARRSRPLFREVVELAIQKDFRDGTFDPGHLEKDSFEPTQDGKLFQLYPKSFPR